MTESTPPPTPRPVPRPIPKPHPVGTAKSAPSRSDPAVTEAATWGGVDDEGDVWLRSGDSERIVGQYAAEGSRKGALTIYVRRYSDLEAQLALIETRVETINPEESASALRAFDRQIVEPLAVGDIEELRDHSATLVSRVSKLRAEYKAKREQAKTEARAQREALVEHAEAITASVNTPINWRDTWAELMELLERWKDARKSGPRASRSTNDVLWKRLSHTRKVFEGAHRALFARSEKEHAHVVAAKERLISEAETVAKSTDRRETSNGMRRLVNEWKAAGRTSKRDDNVLQEYFMTAREVFFSARSARHTVVDQEFANNLAAKLELLVEMEALLPTDDLSTAQATHRGIGERWEAIDIVPRPDCPWVRGRVRQIADKIHRTEDKQWRRTDPEEKQHSIGMATQLEVLITEPDGEVTAAEGTGDEAKVEELNETR